MYTKKSVSGASVAISAYIIELR